HGFLQIRSGNYQNEATADPAKLVPMLKAVIEAYEGGDQNVGMDVVGNEVGGIRRQGKPTTTAGATTPPAPTAGGAKPRSAKTDDDDETPKRPKKRKRKKD